VKSSWDCETSVEVEQQPLAFGSPAYVVSQMIERLLVKRHREGTLQTFVVVCAKRLDHLFLHFWKIKHVS
jgi:hypothetical protein